MLDRLKSLWKRAHGSSRRELFHRGGILSLAGLLPARTATAALEPAASLQVGDEIYQSIGVRPLINCRGTITVIGEVEIRFGANHSTHTLYLRQQGNQVHGTHQGTLWPAT